METTTKISHILLWVGLVLVAAWLVYSATNSRHEKNVYQADSKPIENHVTRWPFTLDFNLSCVRNDVLEQHGKNYNNQKNIPEVKK